LNHAILSQEIRELKNRIDALHNNPNHIDAKAELEKIPGQREKIQHAMEVLRSILEHPERLSPMENGAVYSLSIPDAEASGWERIEAETSAEVMTRLGTRAAHNLDQLTKKQAELGQDEAKLKIIIGGFESELAGLTARRKLLEQDLLRENRDAEQAG